MALGGAFLLGQPTLLVFSDLLYQMALFNGKRCSVMPNYSSCLHYQLLAKDNPLRIAWKKLYKIYFEYKLFIIYI